MDLYRHSIEVILKNQHAGGAYVASPNFETYHYCWLRDGSFTAYAMDVAGHPESAEKFYRWVGSTIARYAGKVDVLEAQLKAGQKPDHRGILNTRFTLEGFEEEGGNDWGNFQVDGYGSWLWGLAEHVRITQNFQLLTELSEPINTTLCYLKLVWQLPNYDCWEEHPEYLHPYSLSTIYGGLSAVADLQSAGRLQDCPINAAELAAEVKEFLASRALLNGRFVKHLWPAKSGEAVKPVSRSGVDASLLGLVVPYGVFDLEDPRITATIQAIEADLHLPGGGVYRYKEDVYYGGGEWIILAAWLGWYYALAGKTDRARELLKWIESTADTNGDLTEQVSTHMLAPKHFEPWREKWGEIANPLLWSHAMYLLLVNVISKSSN
jgi:GH15 family glucan-1,4-alpha-glucosidase